MRATVVAPSVLRTDAVGDATIALVRHLRAQGRSVLLVCGDTADVPVDLAHAVSIAGGPTPDGRLADPATRRHVERSDLVVLVYPCWSPVFGAALRSARGVTLLDYHGVTPPELWSGPGRADLVTAIERLPAIARSAGALVAHSEFARAELSRRAGVDAARIAVLPLPLDLGRFTGVRREDGDGAIPVRLLYVGRMAPSKRIDVLVGALARVRAAGIDARLTLAGDGESEPYRRHLAEALARARGTPAEGAVDVTGRIADEELPALYAASAVYVSASEHEGFGVAFAEAMAAGVPVVASRAGAVPETVGDAALLAAPGDPEALGDAVLRVLRETDLRARLVAAGRARATDFAPERFAAALGRVLDDAGVPAPESFDGVELAAEAPSGPVRPLAAADVRLRLRNARSAQVPGGTPLRLHWRTPDGALLAGDVAEAAVPEDVAVGRDVTFVVRVTAPAAPGSYVLDVRLGAAGGLLAFTVAGDPLPGAAPPSMTDLANAASFAPSYRDASHRTGLWRLAVRVRAAMTRHLARTHVDVLARRHAGVERALACEVRRLRGELAAERAAREAHRRATDARIEALERAAEERRDPRPADPGDGAT